MIFQQLVVYNMTNPEVTEVLHTIESFKKKFGKDKFAFEQLNIFNG